MDLDTDKCAVCDAVEGALFVDIGVSAGRPGQYYLSRQETSSFDAQYACSRIQGYLAEIETETEFDVVRSYLERRVINHEWIHLGGVVHAPSRTVRSSQTSMTVDLLYADWHNREPEDQPGDQCLALLRKPRNRGIKMSAINCTSVYGRFLCEL